jgi:transposase
MKIAVLGIDLGKTSCSVVGLDGTGHVVMRRRMHRDSVIKFASGMAPCVVAMEACCGAHHLGRIVRDHGHQVRLMSPEYVRPYVKAQKNDDRDAEAIAEAATRPTMRFVELKSAEVHGARGALPSLSASTTPLGKWLKDLLQRAHKNTVIVALANKLARIVWAVLRHGGTYDAAVLTVA